MLPIILYSDGKSVGCSDISYTTNYTTANTLSFTSKKYCDDKSQIRLVIGGKLRFGGECRKPVEGDDLLFKHDVFDYSIKLGDKITETYKNKTSSSIAKQIATKHLLATGGIKTTKKKHTLAFENEKALDMMYQLANLEDKMRFYVNHNGKPVFEKIPSQEKGYVFNASNVSGYDITYDSTKIITGVKVVGKDNKEYYNYSNKKLAATYGVITEVINNSEISDKTTAKNLGTETFNKTSKRSISAKIRIPGILPDLVGGMWCAFTGRPESPSPIKTWWVDSVSTHISGNKYYQEATLLDGKPDPPDNWLYKPPNKSSLTQCTTKTVSNPKAVLGSCNGCSNKPAAAKGSKVFQDHCPKCGKDSVLQFNPKGVSEGEWTCKKCDADFCAKCGKEKMSNSKVYLNKSTAKNCGNVKGVDPAVSTKAQELGNAQAIFKYVLGLPYHLYMNNKYGLTVAQVMEKGGNCYMKSALLVDMFKSIGITSERKCGRKCGKWDHCNVEATINGQKYLIDAACKRASGGVFKKI